MLFYQRRGYYPTLLKIMDSFLLRSYKYIMHSIFFTIIQQLVLPQIYHSSKFIRNLLNLIRTLRFSSFRVLNIPPLPASSVITRKKKKKILADRNYIIYPNLHGIQILFREQCLCVILPSLQFEIQILYTVLEADLATKLRVSFSKSTVVNCGHPIPYKIFNHTDCNPPTEH